MSSLMIRCPKTGLDVWTGVDTDLDMQSLPCDACHFLGELVLSEPAVLAALVDQLTPT